MFGGGLKVTTTLDPELQAAANAATNNGQLWVGGPAVSLVAIENKTGAVRAMVGGTNYDEQALQPGHQRPPPARLGLQAVHPGGGASEGRRSRLGVQRRRRRSTPCPAPPARRSSSRATTRTATRVPSHLRRPRRCPTTRCSRTSGFKVVGTKRVAPHGRATGHPHRGVHQPRHDARRPQGGRDAARDGVRVLHDRQPRQAGVPEARVVQVRPGGHRQGREHRAAR